MLTWELYLTSYLITHLAKKRKVSILISIHVRKKIRGIHPYQKIQIKLEIDTDPPLNHLPLESKLVQNPIPFYVSTYAPSDLFASKLHAALYRNWKNRIKGRDWYDVIWYVQKDIPVNLPHLRERMLLFSSKISKDSVLVGPIFSQPYKSFPSCNITAST